MMRILLPFLCCLQLGLSSQTLPPMVHRLALPDSPFGAEALLYGDTTQQRPLLVYCTGSMPVPLFLEVEGKSYSSLPFRYEELIGRCHILVLSKFAIPLVAGQESVDQFQAYTDKGSGKPPAAYLRSNTLGNYTEAHLALLDLLRGKAWIDGERVLVAGHSAGARLAAKVAAQSEEVSHLAYLSAEPRGRIVEMLRLEPGRSASPGASLLEWLDFWRDVNRQSEQVELPEGDSYATWHSNSEDVLDDLLGLDIPVFAAMGMADPKAAGMVAIPCEFIRAGKENLSFVPYEGLEHSFFEVDAAGRVNYEAYHWPAVVADVLDWWLEGKRSFDLDLRKAEPTGAVPK